MSRNVRTYPSIAARARRVPPCRVKPLLNSARPMRQRGDTQNAPGDPPRLLSRRDLVYLLGLLLPFTAYDLALKAARVSSLPDEHGLLGFLKQMRSDLLFDAAYALLWIGLFAVARRGLWRFIVV